MIRQLFSAAKSISTCSNTIFVLETIINYYSGRKNDMEEYYNWTALSFLNEDIK